MTVLDPTESFPRRSVLRGLATVLGLAALPALPRLAVGQIAAQDLVLTPEAPFVVSGPGPATLTYGTVTFTPGASSMTFRTPVTLTCQTLVRQ